MCNSSTGRPIVVGDKIMKIEANGNVFAGVVVGVTPSDTSNVIMQPLKPRDQVWGTAGEFIHVDDAAEKIAPPAPRSDGAGTQVQS